LELVLDITHGGQKMRRNIGADFTFYVKIHHFRVGAFMSGSDFSSSNNYSFHLCYGWTKRKRKI
jgi:hypothetical protein